MIVSVCMYVKPVQQRQQWPESKPSMTAAQTSRIRGVYNSSFENFKLCAQVTALRVVHSFRRYGATSLPSYGITLSTSLRTLLLYATVNLKTEEQLETKIISNIVNYF